MLVLGMYSENRATEDQYKSLDGNPRRYLNKLRTSRESRKGLHLDHLVEILDKQKGLCAITGIEMTYRAEPGSVFPYNASIDRVIPACEGGKYETGNVQLVCKIANDIKRHYRGSDVRQAIREFAEKVIQQGDTEHSV